MTVDNVAKVMEMVTADRIMRVWEMLGVPKELVEMISEKHSTPKEKTRACVDLYLNCHPDASWNKIITGLYRCGEMAAAREAKPFIYHQNGRHPCLCVETATPNNASLNPFLF